MSCLNLNYSTEKHSGELNVNLFGKYDNVEELVENIKQGLKDCSFSSTLDSSENKSAYEESIDTFIQDVIKKLELDNTKDINYLTDELKQFLLPSKEVIDKQEESAEINETRQDRHSKKYNDIIDQYFKNNTGAKNRRSELVSQQLLLESIIDTKKKLIVTDQVTLNQNFENYKARQFEILKKYLQSIGYTTTYPQSLYRSHRIVSTYNNVMDDMYNLLQEKIENGTLEDDVKFGWLNNQPFFEALNAYLNIQYFDQIIKDSLGKYININEFYAEPITIETKNDIEQAKFKYSFSAGNSEAVKGWETSEVRDAIKEMGKFSKLIIESVPMVDYKFDTNIGINLNAVRFSNAITKLKDAIDRLPDSIRANKELKKLRNDMIAKGEENFPQMLELIFKDRNLDTQLRDALKKNGISDFDLNVLYSIHKTVYKGTESYNAIEQKFFATRGEITSRYPIVRTLIGLINSTVTMNYLESKYDINTGTQKIGIKKKFSTDQYVHNMVTNVNTTAKNPKLLEEYPINYVGKNYTITIGSQTYSIKPKNTNSLGVLAKNGASKITITYDVDGEVAPLEIDFDIHRIKNIIDKEGLNDNEQQLVKILEFIDKNLKTSFSLNEQSLLELKMLMQLDSSGFNNLFLAAFRNMVITQIKDKFDKSGLTKLELEKFLEENEEVYPTISIAKQTNEVKKSLIGKSVLGNYLTVLSSSEDWLHNLSHAKAIVTGDISKAVIKNVSGDSVPNFTTAYEGEAIKRRSQQATDESSASSHLLSAIANNMIHTNVIDTDIVTKNGKKKAVKDFTKGELLVHSIVDKYLLPQVTDTDRLIIQPTTYSDKTKFINYLISRNININGQPINLTTASNEVLEEVFMATIGAMYKEVWDNTMSLYDTLFSKELIAHGGFNTTSEKVNFINKLLHSHTEESLMALGRARSKEVKYNIEIHKDTHYRKIKNFATGEDMLSINELLYTYQDLYNSQEKLHKRLEREKIAFVESLIKNRVTFDVSKENGNLDKSKNDLTTVLINRLGSSNAKKWVSGKKMIIAKIINESVETNVIYGNSLNLKAGDTLVLNPLLDNFFMVHTLVGNNTRFMLSGSEINHKVKSLGKLNLAKTAIAKFSNFLKPYGVEDLAASSLDDVKHAIELAKSDKQILMLPTEEISYIGDAKLVTSKEEVQENLKVIDAHFNTINALENIVDELIYKLESAAQNAQLKRNVIIPATLRYYTQGALNGITRHMKVAVFNDTKANVFNFDGLQDDGLDAHDGAAFEDPFTSMLENLSLQDNEVGTIKKPIWHHYDHAKGTAFLGKYAVHTMTNQWMRQSEASTISLRNLFKKMTNLQWKGDVDLIDGCDYRRTEKGHLNSRIDFVTHILEGNKLYYKKGNNHYQILNFGRDEKGDYYTEEIQVTASGGRVDGAVKQKVYHYYDLKGNHSNVKLEGMHTINSLYELHTALGGIFCESMTQDNGLQYSEASVKAVVNYMNNVAIATGDAKSPLTQDYYRQPLKEYLISYAANDSSIKNGVANINQASALEDDTELGYMTVSTEGHGIQMDADHHADEAQMTEFSQVISSLDAGGRLHNYVKQIYNVLGQVALDQAQVELDAIKDFNDKGDISVIYDIVGRTIINNLAGKQGQAGLAEHIVKAVKKQFDLNSNHNLDKFKIPFSDPNIYSNILSTFVSIINNKSIKRKYPGLGTVMVPGYNISQIWEFDGRTYQYEELVKLANANGFTSDKFDVNDYNKDIVAQYLKSKQDEVPFTTLDMIMPTDIVDIYKDDNFEKTIVLENIDDYYEFKADPAVFLLKKGIVTTNAQLKYKKNISKARNLAPAKIWFQYTDGKVVKNCNIFDTWALKDAYSRKLKRSNPEVQKNVQQVLDGLSENKYYHPEGNKSDENGTYFDLVGEVHTSAAEIIMSNIYKSKFGVKTGQSINDVLDNSLSFYTDPEFITSKKYDLVYTKGNNQHLYISFSKLKSSDNNESFEYKRRPWKYIHKKEFVNPEYTYNEETKTYTKKDGVKILNKVYATDKDNIVLFEIGREILRTDIQYNPTTGKFEKDGKVLKNQKAFRRLNNSEVIEYVEFVHQNNVVENGKNYTLYTINRPNLEKVLSVKDPLRAKVEVNEYISKLLAKIYKASSYNGIQVQKELNRNSAIILESTIRPLADQLSYDQDLKQMLYDTHTLLKGASKLEKDSEGKEIYNDYIIHKRKYNKVLSEYQNNLKNSIKSSYLKSQYFTASRIPAQTLQSFMQMKCVGYTGTETNQCFVSHWQTWLQGSDYDIDKAYIMGYGFNDNGKYIGWSDMFKYSSIEAIKASEYLPAPTRKRYDIKETGFDLSLFEKEYEAAQGDVDKTKVLVKVLNYLNDNNINKLKTTNDSVLYQDILRHEDTDLPRDLKLDAYKNFISSHIQNTVQHIRNMVGAYSPIAMDVIRDASQNHSSKGNEAAKMTLMNPAVVYLMQHENMVGKKVIGIAATGEKAAFMWHYWLNDVINTGDFEKYGWFDHKLSRIQNRSKGEPVESEINTLPDVLKISPDLKQLKGDLTVDLLISQILSAATDNAKELILAKINAGSKLAKCYLYLITMGYNIDDIVKFMTSDAISFIDLYSEENIYSDLNLNIEKAIELAYGTIPNSVIKHYLKGIEQAFRKTNPNFEGNLSSPDSLKNPFNKITEEYDKAQAFIDFINEVKVHRSGNMDTRDLDDFKKVLAGANEFSNFGRLLGMNQGLPTAKTDLRNFLQFFQNIVYDREKELGIVDKNGDIVDNVAKEVLGESYEKFKNIIHNFNVVKYLRDPEYKNLIIDYQNKIKQNIPIFKIVESIPQFRSIVKLLGTVEQLDSVSSIKSKAFDAIMDSLKQNNYYVDEFMQKSILSYIDDNLIINYLQHKRFIFPITEGTETFTSQWAVQNVGTAISIDSPIGAASFKYVFENVVIPALQEGYYFDGKTKQYSKKLHNNKFIQGLLKTIDDEVPLYKADLDMLNKDSSTTNAVRFQDYSNGLRSLAEFKIGNTNLANWFILYNLIANKNKYGSERMTTLLQELVNDNNLINDYLNYIGKLDYAQQIPFEFNLQDVLIATAKTVTSTYGRLEPMLNLITDDGPVLVMRGEGGKYDKFPIQEIEEISGEPKEKYLERLYNRTQFGTFRVNYNSYIEKTIKKLTTLNEAALEELNSLIRQGALIITNVCK